MDGNIEMMIVKLKINKLGFRVPTKTTQMTKAYL
jgi:hypothetical protein